MKLAYKFILLLLMTNLPLKAQTASDAGVETILKDKINTYLVDYYKGKPQAYAELFIDNGVMVNGADKAQGKELIRNIISRYQIPKTEYTVQFHPIDTIQDTYVMNYFIEESSGFKIEMLEVWVPVENDFGIALSKGSVHEPEGESGGLSLTRFILSSIILGLFLFLVLVIYRNAKNFKASKS